MVLTLRIEPATDLTPMLGASDTDLMPREVFAVRGVMLLACDLVSLSFGVVTLTLETVDRWSSSFW